MHDTRKALVEALTAAGYHPEPIAGTLWKVRLPKRTEVASEPANPFGGPDPSAGSGTAGTRQHGSDAGQRSPDRIVNEMGVDYLAEQLGRLVGDIDMRVHHSTRRALIRAGLAIDTTRVNVRGRPVRQSGPGALTVLGHDVLAEARRRQALLQRRLDEAGEGTP